MGRYIDDSENFVNMGGYADLTADEDAAEKLIWLSEKTEKNSH